MPAPDRGTTSARRADAAAPRRVFFALWPDAATRDAIAAIARGVVERTGGRSPQPGNVHLTLAFVGEVAPERIAVLESIGGAAARATAPFTLSLDRLGSFREARVAWLGVETVPKSLADLVQRLNEGLTAQAFRVERRPFRVHATLARKIRSPLPGEVIAPVEWKIERLALVASELAAGGSRYRVLAEWPLGKSGSDPVFA